MSSYLKNALTPATQTEQADPRQVKNSAGGFVFAVDDWTRLDRFLILGSEGGTYYASERKLTRENAQCVDRCVKADGARTVAAIVAVSDSGRAPKNDPAILSLAIAARTGDDATRKLALEALPKVCRTGTHLYHFAEFANQLGGWGRGLRRAIASWFTSKSDADLAMQLVKYQSRDGWSSRDLLRLSHAKPTGKAQDAMFAWATADGDEANLASKIADLPAIVMAHDELKKCDDVKRAIKLIREYKLPRESVSTQLLTKPEIWEALLPHMGLTAMIRNLATMTRVGLLEPLSDKTAYVSTKITDADALRKARIHPIAVLAALRTYSKGRGERGSSTWTPLRPIVDALDSAFYASFGAVVPAGKPTLLALDVSGSMGWGEIAGIPGLTPREAAAAMALVTAATEPNYHFVGFSHRLVDVPISSKMRLHEACNVMEQIPMGSTDCSIPFVWAKEQRVKVGMFHVYTDNETYAGRIHPNIALQQYRNASGVNARSAVIGLTATNFTIADPTDAGMMDVVGFDAAAPAVIADFARG